MSLKVSAGNMYPWVTHTHSFLGGECPHKCSYCYVNNPKWGRPERYQGSCRLIESEFNIPYNDKTLLRKGGKIPSVIFIEHMNDLFAKGVPDIFIQRILAHCNKYPSHTYVFQTKNPQRYMEWEYTFPESVILGTTIESNRWIPEHMEQSPTPKVRYLGMLNLSNMVRKFVTIEPVMDFDVDELAQWIADIKPEFLNLGADSKRKGLPEPTVEKVMTLVAKLHELGVELREKHNLQRLKQK